MTMNKAPIASWGIPEGGMSILLESSFFCLTRPTSVSSAASSCLKNCSAIEYLLAEFERLRAGLVHIESALFCCSELQHRGRAQPNACAAVQWLGNSCRDFDLVD